VFRLCSSGISQYVDPTGKVVESAPFPGRNEVMSGQIQLPQRGRLPLDRRLASLCVAATGMIAAWLWFDSFRRGSAKSASTHG
jgi:apolipoprotein N-acyltransferase